MEKQNKLFYTAASLFLAWHTMAMVLGPSPYSHLQKNMVQIFQPYLDLFQMDYGWGFYAPNPGAGILVNYLILDEKGEEHSFDVYAQMNKWSAGYYRYNAFFNNVMLGEEHSEPFRISYANYLCRKHQYLAPVSITLTRVSQKPLTFENYRKGARPLDNDYLESFDFNPVSCTKP